MTELKPESTQRGLPRPGRIPDTASHRQICQHFEQRHHFEHRLHCVRVRIRGNAVVVIELTELVHFRHDLFQQTVDLSIGYILPCVNRF